jgi:hypothetical protein
MKADEPRQNRIPFMMSDAELEAVDDWRFANKIATRAEAIRRLCQIGLGFDSEAAALRAEIAMIEAAARKLNPFIGDTFEEDVEAKPSPEQATLLQSEISIRNRTLHMLLYGLLRRLDAYRNGKSIEEADSEAAAAAERMKRVLDARLRAVPNDVRRSMGLEDT